MRRAMISDPMTALVVRHGDCVDVMRAMEAGSIDAIVTDPPYGLEFMGRDWDRLDGWRDAGGMSATGIGERAIPWPTYSGETANPSCRTCGGRQRGARRCSCAEPDWHVRGEDFRPGDGARERAQRMQLWHLAWATEAYRVLKPGGFLLAFGGSRTYHRLACAVEDAGFEIRDSIVWCYSSGFPKSRNVAAAIDALVGATGGVGEVKPRVRPARAEHGVARAGAGHQGWARPWESDPDAVRAQAREYVPGSEEGGTWDGWGTALKPAQEPIVVARKPLAGTIGQNVLQHGTGAINIDGCRVPTTDRFGGGAKASGGFVDGYDHDGWVPGDENGRWPSNFVLTHDVDCDEETCVSGCPVVALDAQSGQLRSGEPGTMRLGENTGAAYGTESRPPGTPMTGYGDVGGASRFYPTFEWDLELDTPFCYQGKASRAERDAGLDDFELAPLLWSSGEQNPGSFQSENTVKAARNNHPTVKPVELMRWLLRLVARDGAVVLDPFTGSGTTGVAAAIEGVQFVGIEADVRYCEIAEARIAHAHAVRDVVRTGRARLRAAARAPEGQDQLF